MSNTQPSQELILADVTPEGIEQLFQSIGTNVTVLNVLKNMDSIAAFAELITLPNLDRFFKLNVSEMTDETLTAWDEFFESTKTRVSNGQAKQQELRKPITTRFDGFTTKCTAQENRITTLKTRLQDCRVIIAKAKAKLASDALAKQNKTINRNTEVVTFKGAFRQHMLTASTGKAGVIIQKMTADFLNLTTETIDLYEKNIVSFSTSIPVEDFHVMRISFSFPWKFHNPSEEITPMLSAEEVVSLEAECNTLFSTAIRQKIDEINNQLPMKRASLKQGIIMTEEDKAAQVQESTAFLVGTAQSALQQASYETVVERIGAAEANTVIIPQQSKGTSVKKVLKPANAAQWSILIALWCERILPNLTEEEIDKKVGFISTYFTKAGNAGGGWPAGVNMEDDYKPSVRGKKRGEE